MTNTKVAIEFVEKIKSFVKMYETEIPRRAEITLLEEACDQLESKERPPAGEFRQKVTCAILDTRSTEEQCSVALKLLHEAEDIIDRLESSREDLLAVCEAFVKWNKKYPSTTIYGHSAILRIIDELDKIAEQSKAAIAREKEG